MSLQFAEKTQYVGLHTIGLVGGAVVSDFNSGGSGLTSDGDLDIYLGRPAVQEFFYRAAGKNGSQAPDNHRLVMKLETAGANNASCIGAKIKVEYGGITQIQQVDGGGGWSGQGDRVLTFGLGQYNGNVQVEITWPGGHVQTLSLLSQAPENASPAIILDDTAPIVSVGTLDESCTLLPNHKLAWHLSWSTTVSSKWDLDSVEVEIPGESAIVYSQSAGTATLNITAIPGGGYHHALTFTTDCKTGYYKFRARSSVDGTIGPWSDQLIRRNDFCPKGSGGIYPEG